jgi:DNA-binding beta-propeller fold protein YncE
VANLVRGIGLLLLLAAAHAAFGQSYKVTGSIPVGGKGHWDYLIVDTDNRRLYVSHNSEVVVVDVESEKIVGRIPVDGFSHGIALANDSSLGFITDGDSKTSDVKSPEQVVTFDLKTLQRTAKTKVGDDPDSIIYDAPSGRVFAFQGDPMQGNAIDGKTSKVEKVIALGGNPEFAVSDGTGSVYVNIKNKSEIAQIDAKNLTVKARWPLAPCEGPSGLAMDRANRRLFSVCGNGKMAVVDADTGKVIATLPIGALPDGAAYDPGTKLAFASNRDGTLTVIRQVSKDEYTVAQNLKTELGARTMALDTKTHKVYLSSAEFGPKPEGSKYPSVIPDTFKILVLELR